MASEAELVQSVMGRLYQQLVQAASGAVLDRWAGALDALVAELRAGGGFCREAHLLAPADRSTEIDLSNEFPPERRPAQEDVMQANREQSSILSV